MVLNGKNIACILVLPFLTSIFFVFPHGVFAQSDSICELHNKLTNNWEQLQSFSSQQACSQDCQGILAQNLAWADDARCIDTNSSADSGTPTPSNTTESQSSGFTIPNPLKANTITELFDSIASFLLGLVLALGVIIIIWAGFLYVTSSGDPKKLETAKKAIVWAILGIMLALLAKGLVLVIKDVISGSNTNTNQPGADSSQPPGNQGGISYQCVHNTPLGEERRSDQRYATLEACSTPCGQTAWIDAQGRKMSWSCDAINQPGAQINRALQPHRVSPSYSVVSALVLITNGILPAGHRISVLAFAA